ncbi:hypothetical protein OG875_14930 [Streptomyces sp. NBC_01498]|uniref:hypothetical protein n=1 Tax=Streptomyces sp. NBC_01498 TaxID=2975870 RepID=UPI002E7BDAB1|nr:hypothetical protein [Streptomyces sp. NBC_01498]WTL25779.1 hypothetical protein OG875_14930 [Streptomyces sp. NBC_01498]
MKPIRTVSAGFVAALTLGAVSVIGPSPAWAAPAGASAGAAAGCPVAVDEAESFLAIGTRDPVILTNYLGVRIRSGAYVGSELQRAQYLLNELKRWCNT